MELRNALVLVVLAAAAASACGESTVLPPPSSPTALRVDLHTPNTDDGAIVITLRGPDLSNLQPGSAGYLAYFRAASTEETRVIVVGDLNTGALVTLSIAAGHQLSDYSATVEQVASRTDVLRADLSAYRVELSAP